jgi:hypothetical protein
MCDEEGRCDVKCHYVYTLKLMLISEGPVRPFDTKGVTLVAIGTGSLIIDLNSTPGGRIRGGIASWNALIKEPVS